MVLKPQDIFVVLKLVAKASPTWTYVQLANELFMSVAEINAGVRRAIQAGLVAPAESKKQSPRPVRKALEEFKFNDALEAVWRLIGVCDEYISKEKPWEEKDSSLEVVATLLIILGHITWMVRPFLPETSDKIFKQLGIDPESETPWEEQEFKIKKEEALFPRI